MICFTSIYKITAAGRYQEQHPDKDSGLQKEPLGLQKEPQSCELVIPHISRQHMKAHDNNKPQHYVEILFQHTATTVVAGIDGAFYGAHEYHTTQALVCTFPKQAVEGI